jgi:hypothetical protein
MWMEFKHIKPEKKGWYLCTVEVKNHQRYTMNLYWYPRKKIFRDNIVQKICEVYTVVSRGKRIYDIGQDRTKDVIAWREIPKPYMVGFKKK